MHARNRVLKHQSPCPVPALSLPDPSRAIVFVRADGTPQRARSLEEDVREWLAAARAVIVTHDVPPKVRKDVLQVRCLALVVAPPGACRDGDGHTVRDEVSDDSRDARQQLHVRKVRVLRGSVPGEVSVDRERDVREEGE